jgi:hypothetical protein
MLYRTAIVHKQICKYFAVFIYLSEQFVSADSFLDVHQHGSDVM